jgi:hypothetical protein
MATDVALIVLAYDEELFLKDCYDSHAGFFDFTICLVSKSQDKTEEIARRNFDCVHVIDFPGSFGKLREYANELSPCESVLHVDADERFPPSLLIKIRTLARELPSGTALAFPRINPPWYPAPWPDYQARLMRKETRYTGRIHETPRCHVNYLPAIPENAIKHLVPPVRVNSKISRWRSLGDTHWTDIFEREVSDVH